MKPMLLFSWLLLLGFTVLPCSPGRADPILPGVLEPKSAAECWNVIRLAMQNVERLLTENRLEEIPVQISYCSPSLRSLPNRLTNPEAASAAQALLPQAFLSVNAVAVAAQAKNPVGVKAAHDRLKELIGQLTPLFDPKVVAADIYFCPMHPEVISEDMVQPCPKCAMPLVTRRIPYSFIYTTPGAPSMQVKILSGGPAVAGQRLDVKLRLSQARGAPVLLKDLLVMHTQPIHLLIEEPGLGDYHHEHPVPGAEPGEYLFSFTPAKSGPYRIWADLVPAASGVQELPFADLPGSAAAATLTDTEERFTSTAGGYQFSLSFREGLQVPTRAGVSRRMTIIVTGPAGQPVTVLEPVMNAFAHLVGFYDDYQTVLHLHPTGGDILNPALRGGPALGFMLHAPKPGFVRLYCQISLGGKMLFAPFNLKVQP